MPPIEEQFRDQMATLWEVSGVDDYGRHTVREPVEIKVRWVGNKAASGGKQDELESESVTVLVTRSIRLGSIVRLGPLNELPEELDGLFVVRTYADNPDIKGRSFNRAMTVQRFRNALPTIVE
jgi:hypothetical protein